MTDRNDKGSDVTDFKPGDVAANPYGGLSHVVESGCHMRGLPHWHNGERGWHTIDTDGFRRLVVIDPESAEDMGRLSGIWHATRSADLEDDMSLSADGWRLRLVLREFATPTPPRPDEPTGLGAVVEDGEGQRWVRRADGWTDKPWARSDRAGLAHYTDIAAVRVLSEGVTP